MEISTSYALKLFFPTSSFIQVYFEAIANSIDAGADQVDVSIKVSGSIADSPEIELDIDDNGEGLTEERFERFRRLDEPQDVYHKGLGRLVYLNYFEQVEVESRFSGRERLFTFSRDYDGTCRHVVASSAEAGTSLRFRGFRGKRIHSYDDLRPVALKERVIHQFLPMLHDRKQRNESLMVRFVLQTDAENQERDFVDSRATLTLDDVPDLQYLKFTDFTIDAIEPIEMWYAVEPNSSTPTQLTAFSVDGRTIPSSLLKKRAIPEHVMAVFIFQSKVFRTDTERQRLKLPDEVTEKTVVVALRDQVSSVLNSALPEISQHNDRVRRSYEDRYPHLQGLFPDHSVGLIDREEAIKSAQGAFFRKQREVLESGERMNDDLFEQALEVSARTLLEYILYREFIITKLRGVTESDREDVIHNLIVPQRTKHDGARFVDTIYTNNAWLIDDKFMTFRTILSEAEMGKIISAITLDDEPKGENERPDVSLVFNAHPETNDAVDVVIVEIKRKTDDDKENTYAPVQLLKRARKLVEHCPNIERAWYYAIIQISPELGQLLRDDGWKPLYSKGIVFYKENRITHGAGRIALAPTYIMSFDAMTADAAARNHSFLQLLRSDFARASRGG